MKILVAEDDSVFQLVLRGALSRWGYEPVMVGDGAQAWEQLTSPSGPRLAILDWVMPIADGLEVCRKVRSANLPYYVYIILLTGKTDANDLVAGLEAGADDYLAKPVNLNELKLRLRAGSRVLESEERHRIIAETASDGIVTLERGDAIHFANSAAGAIFGYSASELVGQPLSLLVPDFERLLDSNIHLSCGDVSQGLRSWPSIEMNGKHRTGREAVLEVSFSEFVDSSRKRILTAMIRDVTERLLRERHHAQAQKLESIGQLAAGIAHEINTPIQYIGDNGRFLEEEFHDLAKFVKLHCSVERSVRSDETGRVAVLDPEPETVDVDVEFLQAEIPVAISQLLEGVDHVARIVRAMKEFSHPGTLEKKPVDINHAIENTILVSKNEWKYVAEVITDFDEKLEMVPCLAGEFNQVMLNLIVNAAHAIGDATKKTGGKGSIRVTTLRNEGWGEIRVSDTGTGIPEAIRGKVFDPFFTTKEVGKGTGQGLTIAHSVIVQKHGGRLSFETEQGVGTTFIVQLPLAAEAAG